MTLDQDVALLRSLPIFSAFSDEQLRLIAFSAEPLNLPEGTVLFREGAAADGGYVIESGAVRLYSAAEGGETLERGVAGAGALIGEMALVCATARPATAETLEPTSLIAISRRLLRRVLEEYPDMAQALRHTLAERLTGMNAELARTREALLKGESETAD